MVHFGLLDAERLRLAPCRLRQGWNHNYVAEEDLAELSEDVVYRRPRCRRARLGFHSGRARAGKRHKRGKFGQTVADTATRADGAPPQASQIAENFANINDLIDSEYASIIANIVKMILSLLIINHFIACAWFLIANQDLSDTWI